MGVLVWLSAVTIIVACLVPLDANGCPAVCTCDLAAKAAVCAGQGLAEVPTDLPRDITRLDLGSNRITELRADSFERYQDLESIDVQSNKISRLDQETFSATKSLNRLIIKGNRISTLTLDHVSQLKVLDLSDNHLVEFGKNVFVRMSSLEMLNLSRNFLEEFANITFAPGTALAQLDLSQNNFTNIPANAFINCTRLQSLRLNNLANLTLINQSAFRNLKFLHTLEMRNNPHLFFLHRNLFHHMRYLHTLDLSSNNISSLYEEAFYGLTALRTLSVHNNPLLCNCALKWLHRAPLQLRHANDTRCTLPESLRAMTLLEVPSVNLSCIAPKIIKTTLNAYFKIGSQAVLKCLVEGKPMPAVMWITPHKKTFVHNNYLEEAWNKNPTKEELLGDLYHLNHEWHNSQAYRTDTSPNRIQLLANGDLFIDYVQRNDAGDYMCVASSPAGNDTRIISFKLNYIIIKDITVASMIVGFSSACIFFGFGLLVGLVRYISRKCAERQRKKRKTIRKIITHLDTYRSQQIDKLRDNYGGHMIKMKEHALVQMDKMRENYFNQITRIQDKCASQMDRLRDNYNTQMGKIKGYSTQHVEKIRENYNNQMIKIRDYGSTQLDKLRETYKLQHQHLMKILEAMNIDNCRGVVDSECMRANSTLFFETHFTMDHTHFTLDPLDIKLDDDDFPLSKPSSRNSVCISDDFLTANSDSDSFSLDNVARNVEIGTIGIDIVSELDCDVENNQVDIRIEDDLLNDAGSSTSRVFQQQQPQPKDINKKTCIIEINGSPDELPNPVVCIEMEGAIGETRDESLV